VRNFLKQFQVVTMMPAASRLRGPRSLPTKRFTA